MLVGMSTTDLSGPSPQSVGRLRAKLVQDLRTRLLEEAVSLPLGDQAALMLVADLCRDPCTPPNEIAEAAARDESFSSTLLRVANSAAVAATAKAADLTTAVVRLGSCFVESLAVSTPTLRLLAAPSDGLELPRRELHRHAIRVGLLARAIAPAGVDPNRALAAGIVHNLGLGVLSLCARSGFRRLLDATASGGEFLRVEAELFGFTHPQLGGLLARRWCYPDTLVEAIEDHAEERPRTQLAALVQVADLLVREAGFGIEPPRAHEPELLRLAGVDDQQAFVAAMSLLVRTSANRDRSGESSAPLASVLDALI
jgi:HD-like signal output (HDOD) protein